MYCYVFAYLNTDLKYEALYVFYFLFRTFDQLFEICDVAVKLEITPSFKSHATHSVSLKLQETIAPAPISLTVSIKRQNFNARVAQIVYRWHPM